MNLDIIIRYLLDKQASAEVEKGSRQVAGSLGELEKKSAGISKGINDWSKSLEEAERLSKKFGDEFTRRYEAAVKSGKSLEEAIAGVRKELEKVEKPASGGNTRIQQLQAEALLLRATASAITDDLEKAQLATISNLADRLAGLSTLALGTGTGIVGGIFAAANKYVQDAEEATAVTLEWKAAQDSLERSGQRIGAVLAERALPLLHDVERLASQVAGFVESHPEAITAALNTGKILIALGAVGLLASKGVKLYADVQYLLTIPAQLEAARLQDRAADKQLAAAVLRAKAQGIDVPSVPGGGTGGAAGAGGLLAGLASPAGAISLILATGVASVSAADKLKQLEERLVRVGGPATAPVITFFDTVLKVVNPLVPAIKNLRSALERDIPLIKNLLGIASTTGAGTGVKGVASVASLSSVPQEALRAYEQYRADDLQLIQDHYRDRQRIIVDSLKAEQAENARYASSVSRIRSQTARALSDAADDLARDNERAAQEFTQRQAEIVRDGEESIEQIRRQSAERLRQLELNHAQRVEDLTARRDALGLAKERRQHAQAVAEENRQTNQEIQERRRETAQRLADLQQSFEQERVQRQADYQARVTEIRANAAQQLAELAGQHAAELREIRTQRIARIRELDAQFLDERKRRREHFLDQIREIDAGLLGEADLRKQRQAQMLQDLDAFLSAYRSKLQGLGSTGTTGSRSTGGYATFGRWLLGDDRSGGPGAPEYVIRGTDTKMIERMIGGQITPEKLMARLAVGSSHVNSDSRAVTYNDQRRFDSRLSAAERERLRQDAVNTIVEALQ